MAMAQKLEARETECERLKLANRKLQMATDGSVPAPASPSTTGTQALGGDAPPTVRLFNPLYSNCLTGLCVSVLSARMIACA